MLADLSGRVAVITGAASGIGLGLAQRCAAEGMSLVLADIEEEPLVAAAKRLESEGAEVVAVPTDVADGAQVQALADEAESTFGTWHLVCLNAGVGGGGMAWQLTAADWQWVLGVNLWGVIHGIRVFVPRLVEQGEGHVVNTASMAGMLSGPGMGPYNASKHAVVAITETLRADLALSGSDVGASVLCPGWVNTRISEADRNRPEGLRNPDTPAPTPEQQAIRGLMSERLAAGMAPADVAGLVVDAVTTGRFYVFTDPDFVALAKGRFDAILAEADEAFPRD